MRYVVSLLFVVALWCWCVNVGALSFVGCCVLFVCYINLVDCCVVLCCLLMFRLAVALFGGSGMLLLCRCGGLLVC